MQCIKKKKKNSNRELIAVCAAYLHPSTAPLLHGNEAMNGSMSTGRGSRRAMQLWTPTHETRTFLPISSGSHLRGLVLKWQRGGGGKDGLVEALISYGGGRKQERRRRGSRDPGEGDNVSLSRILLSFDVCSSFPLRCVHNACLQFFFNVCACLCRGA